MNNIKETYKHLVIINIIFFIASNFFIPTMYDKLALHSFDSPKFEWYQLISHMFMHAKYDEMPMHIVFNMIALYSLGGVLEHCWGAKRFLFFYIICGIGAGFIHNLASYVEFHDSVTMLINSGLHQSELLKFFDSYAVGASGAIYGLLVAYGLMFPNNEVYLYFAIPIKAKILVPGLILLDLFSGYTGFSIFGTGIAHFAHVGGALIGFLLMMLWRKNRFEHNRWN